MTFHARRMQLLAVATVLVGIAAAVLINHSQSASSKGEDRQAQTKALERAVSLYPALSGAGSNESLSSSEQAKIAKAPVFARGAGFDPVGRVVIDSAAVRARVVTNGADVCLWITYPDSSGSLGCRLADGGPFGAVDSVEGGQLRFTGVLGNDIQASINGKSVSVENGAFTQIVSVGDRVTMGGTTRVVSEP